MTAMVDVENAVPEDRVILVDPDDRELGAAPKLDVHHSGALHRAFSIFVFDERGALLLQRRARGKYHSGGLWTNTCCGHPRPGEATADAGRRRLREEMGFTCPLTPVGTFTYRATVGDGLVEHELDHVLVGQHGGVPIPDPAEVSAWRRMPVPELEDALRRTPGRFTAWLRLALTVVLGPDIPGSPRRAPG